MKKMKTKFMAVMLMAIAGLLVLMNLGTIIKWVLVALGIAVAGVILYTLFESLLIKKPKK